MLCSNQEDLKCEKIMLYIFSFFLFDTVMRDEFSSLCFSVGVSIGYIFYIDRPLFKNK